MSSRPGGSLSCFLVLHRCRCCPLLLDFFQSYRLYLVAESVAQYILNNVPPLCRVLLGVDGGVDHERIGF